MKTAIITGGGSGIGLAVAHALAGEKFRVGLIGRRAEAVKGAAEAVAAAGGEAWWGAVDVRDESAVRDFVNAAARQYKKIDLLVNNAGVFKILPVEETSVELWDEMLDINLKGAFICAKAAWPHIGGGQIINISSTAGLYPFEGNAAYSASKYGLIGLSEVLAVEGKARNIRVHVVCPGGTRTPMWDEEPSMTAEQAAETVRWLAVSPPDVTFEKIVIRPML